MRASASCVGTALGRQPRRGSLQHAAQLDRVDHVVEAEGAHHEAAVAGAVEQPFLGQPRQRLAHRRARDRELFGQRHLEQPRAAGRARR